MCQRVSKRGIIRCTRVLEGVFYDVYEGVLEDN